MSVKTTLESFGKRDRTFWAVLFSLTLTVCLLVVVSWTSMKVLTAIRAYVTGEGLYSKAQKNAIYFLTVYIHSGD